MEEVMTKCPENLYCSLLVHYSTLLFTSGCFLVSAAEVIAGVATMELLQFLKLFNKKWYFLCTIYSITYCFSLIILTLI